MVKDRGALKTNHHSENTISWCKKIPQTMMSEKSRVRLMALKLEKEERSLRGVEKRMKGGGGNGPTQNDATSKSNEKGGAGSSEYRLASHTKQKMGVEEKFGLRAGERGCSGKEKTRNGLGLRRPKTTKKPP